MAYEFDEAVYQPGGGTEGMPADWHLSFVNRAVRPGHYVIVQMGSIGVSEDVAKRLAAGMLAGLNAAVQP